MGFTTRGKFVQRLSSSTMGAISLGPKEQFIPRASTPRPSRVRAMAGIPRPVNVRMLASNVMVHIMGKSEFSFTARIAAFAS